MNDYNIQQKGRYSLSAASISHEQIRKIVHEEIESAFARRENQELNDLLEAIEERPLSEQEEMAAVLATLTEEEWRGLVERVKERKASA